MRHEAKFGRQLPRIRRRVRYDLDQPGLPRPKVLACIIRILDDVPDPKDTPHDLCFVEYRLLESEASPVRPYEPAQAPRAT